MENNLKYETNYLLNIDILGFGKLVEKSSIEEVFNFYAPIITGSTFVGEIIEKGSTDIMVYSDTIAIKSNKSDKDQALSDLIKIAHTIQAGQYYQALNQNELFIPLRGTISYGDFLWHKGGIWTQTLGKEKVVANNVHLIFGKPIVDSYNFEKDMNVMGIALPMSVVINSSNDIIQSLTNQNYLIEYSVPLKKKDGKQRSHWGFMVSPCIKAHHEYSLKRLQTEKLKQTDANVICKYENTISFFNFIQQHRLFYPGKEHYK